MQDQAQLHDLRAIDKLKGIIKHNSLCMMVTDVGHYPGHSRPMAVAEVDEKGAFWFLTLNTSAKFDELANDPRMSLYFADPLHKEFMTVHGCVEVLNDMARKKALWSPLEGVWVPDGVENPDLRILKMTPEDGYYWDTKNAKTK